MQVNFQSDVNGLLIGAQSIDGYLEASNIKIIGSKYIRSKPNQLLA